MARLYITLMIVLLAVLPPAADASDFAGQVMECVLAPGQWVNDAAFNEPAETLEAPSGGGTSSPGNSSIMSLGGFGGSIVLRFDDTVIDDPAFLAAMRDLVREKHRTLVRLSLSGRSAEQIAERLGYKRASTVDNVKRRPEVRAALEAGGDYLTRLWAANEVIPDWMVKKPIQELVGPATTVLAELMRSDDEKVRIRAAAEVMKLAGVKGQAATPTSNGGEEVGGDVLRGLLESIKAVQAEGDGGDPVA